MYASTSEIRFTKKEIKRFINILIQSFEYSTKLGLTSMIAIELHNIFIRQSVTSTKSFNHIMASVNKFPTDFGLDMKFESKKGNYYHSAYSKGLKESGKSHLMNIMTDQLYNSMVDVWDYRGQMSMIFKMRESGVPSDIVNELAVFMNNIGCNDIYTNDNKVNNLRLVVG